MPDIVAHGKRPDARACGLCHYPNGKGRQENAGVPGLPVSYFIQQMNDFRSGAQKERGVAQDQHERDDHHREGDHAEEIRQAAAEYFGAMQWTPWVRVVESEHGSEDGESRRHLGPDSKAPPSEPLGMRIIETPEDAERTEILRDPRSGFIAYAPSGSLKKGEALVKTRVRTGDGRRRARCATAAI